MSRVKHQSFPLSGFKAQGLLFFQGQNTNFSRTFSSQKRLEAAGRHYQINTIVAQ
jgi:hypothetical protein